MEPFELFAVKFSQHDGRKRDDNFVAANVFLADDPHLNAPQINYYVWVARRSDKTYIIDTGFEARAAHERGRLLDGLPTEQLARLGIRANDITDVILTHLHYDHAGGMTGFPRARFHVQDAEAAYATGRCMCHDYLRYPFDVEDISNFVRLNFAGRIAFHDSDDCLADGITLHRVGGHTGGMQVVRVFTQRGWVVIASDATHFYANYRNNLVFPVVYNTGGLLDGYMTIRKLAASDDHIIPGHDPLVMELYPSPSPDLAGVVACLHLSPVDFLL